MHSLVTIFARTFVSGSKRVGHFGPGSESSRVLLADSLLGANGPRSKKAVNPSTVCIDIQFISDVVQP